MMLEARLEIADVVDVHRAIQQQCSSGDFVGQSIDKLEEARCGVWPPVSRIVSWKLTGCRCFDRVRR